MINPGHKGALNKRRSETALVFLQIAMTGAALLKDIRRGLQTTIEATHFQRKANING
jgi:hypothetical protein